MLNATDILNKLNAHRSGKRKKSAPAPVGLADIMVRSLPEVRTLAGKRLTHEEQNFLYQQAQHELKENRVTESSILSRANPQLAQSVRLGIVQSALRRGYDDMFGKRAERFARTGSVASMFSPAGYLTELYREACKLHAAESQNHLNNRRPDLKSLMLTQENMDTEISTLSLSNEILVAKIGSKDKKAGEPENTYAQNLAAAVSSLACDKGTGETPFGLYYETARQALLLQDKDFSVFRDNPAVTRRVNTPSLLLLEAGISPSLYKILTEDFSGKTGDKLTDLLKNYFSDAEIRELTVDLKKGKTTSLSRYYGLTHDNVASILAALPDEYKNKIPVVGGDEHARVLLLLNKFIRLCKATSLSPSDVRTIIESAAGTRGALDITDVTVATLEWVHCYMKRYGISAPDALVLAGVLIGQNSHPDRPDMFTRLFNSPLMDGKEFKADNTPVSLNPEEINDTYRTGVLKRAFQVNDAELYTLWCLWEEWGTPGEFPCSIENISALYRLKLLADVHGLSVTELAMLLEVSGQYSGAMKGFSLETLRALTDYLDRLTRWLNAQGWRATDLYLMVTTQCSTKLSPDILALLITLRDGLDKKEEQEDKINAAAPFIAAACQLASAGTAEALLRWLDQLKPGGLTAGTFLAEAANFKEDEDKDNTNLVAFCQMLGQLALITRSLKLTTAGLSFAVTHPDKFTTDKSVTDDKLTLPHNVDTVLALARFHDWLQACGTAATEVLSALESNSLTPAQMARAMGLDGLVIAQALVHSQNKDTLSEKGGGCGAVTTNEDSFSSWPEVDTVLQWMDVAARLGITPADVTLLVLLKYTGVPAGKTARPKPKNDESSIQWANAARLLQAGLNEHQGTCLQAVLDEKFSTALSAYAVRHFSELWKDNNAPVTDRDGLYGWLLLDNRVSAEVKTTRLAEAIASIQLYVNRALNGLEVDVDNAGRASNFFRDWDRFNKRYSTWAGISQLVYYPENYIDPTVRTGQTGMMDEVLQALGQSQLTSDTVEAAFRTYMTRFEDIADIHVISGYHDSLNNKEGVTYLVGRSTEGSYYWRSVDIEKLAKTGKIPANAWREWIKITVPVNPVNDLIRPVMFQHRLHIVWLESQVTGSERTMKGNLHDYGANDTPEMQEKVGYVLKYSHIQHDGTWSMPVSVTTGMDKITTGGETTDDDVNIDNASIHCTCGLFHNENILLISVYKKMDRRDEAGKKKNSIQLFILDDGKVELGNVNLPDIFYSHWDTPEQIYISVPFSVEFNVKINSESDKKCGDYINISRSRVKILSKIKMEEDSVKLSLSEISTCAELDKSKNVGKGIDIIGGWGGEYRVSNTYEGVLTPKNSVNCIIKITESATKENVIFFKNTLAWVTWDFRNFFSDNPNDVYEFTGSDIDTASLKGFIPPEKCNDVHSIQVRQEGSDNTVAVFGDFKTVSTNPGKDDIKLYYTINSKDRKDIRTATSSILSSDHSQFKFDDFDITVPLSEISDGVAKICFAFGGSLEEQNLGSEVLTLTLNEVTTTPPTITLNQATDSGAQCLQYGIHAVRINTLFARELTARATAGINAVLSMKTQQLLEPPVPIAGFYATITLPGYDEKVHGDEKDYSVWLWGHQTMYDIECKGLLENDAVTITLFIPYLGGYYYTATEGIHPGEEAVALYLKTKNKTFSGKGEYVEVAYSPKTRTVRLITEKINPDVNGFSDVAVSVDDTKDELMDFSGCNGLYFWEMFYYIPMMVFRRLLQEGCFTEATQWIKYIWSPEGYQDKNGNPELYQWNVRPLEEETSWHADPLDSPDPDAVALADPMHYKVSTFMGYLDLLIARGDTAFRQLERDAFNEAKMWYVQALSLLGEEPSGQDGEWINPTLSEAAEQTTQVAAQQALLMIRGETPGDGAVSNANSLTKLFLPQQNEKLAGYWRTLRQRLFNLRHNLSIDGQPLSLSIYASPVSPEVLLSAVVNNSQGGSTYPQNIVMPPYRFPVMLESARELVGQLIQFGSTLLSLTERQDAETLSLLLQTQGAELVRQSIVLQDKTVAEIDKEKEALDISKKAADKRLEQYKNLYDEDVSTAEKQAMELSLSASVLSTTATLSYTVAAGLDTIPNIYGMAVGGASYSAIPRAIGTNIEVYAMASRAAAERLSQSEMYRRRLQEWEIQRDNAESEVKQTEAQLEALKIRREAAVLQKAYLETQRDQTLTQLTFLKNKFTGEALYSWLRGKLSAIYYQFFDLTVSRCLMAQKAYEWSTGEGEGSSNFIRPGAWRGNYAGLMAGEALLLNLTQMEQAYLQKGAREKEVTRTVSLAQVYGKGNEKYSFSDSVAQLLNDLLKETSGLSMKETALEASLTLPALNIRADYPDKLGNKRRIKNISVTLPALVGPYQDVRAVLSYSGGVAGQLPGGCQAMAVSHGMNDSGLFQLDFNDARWLPFEGIPVDDQGTLTLSFPDAKGAQKEILLSLSDIILHIRYTIAG